MSVEVVKLSAWKPELHPEHGSAARITPKGLRIGPMSAAFGRDAITLEPAENPSE